VSVSARTVSRIGPPITVQLVSLSLAGWAVTLIVTAAIVLFLPPPTPPIYRIAELSQALRGGSVTPRDGRPLIRTVQAQPPPVGEPRLSSSIFRSWIAETLRVSRDDVRFERYPSVDPVRRALLRALLWAPPRPTTAAGVLPSSPDDSPGPLASGKGAAPPMAPIPDVSANERVPPVIGDFSAAVRQPGGGWMVVRPSPEPFPTPWQQRFFLWFATCFVLLAPVGYLFARRITAPIGLFSQAAEQLGRDPTAPAIELSGPAEIGRAASAFNEMQARLKRYVEHRTATISAVAHDLRTPLARIRFKIESLPPQEKESIGRDVAMMEQMIATALDFVRDATEVRQRELLDLGSVMQCVVDSAALMRADIRLTSSEALVVEADSLGLERMFSNLVDNAVKYGGRARVRLFREGQSAVVEVSDNGPGLPAAEVERVFEPFYRADPSRSPQTGGMGLGLTVSRTIARAHGGDIELVNARRGLIARVRLPLPAETARPLRRRAALPQPASELGRQPQQA
jgi:signal transduction histidine kinase